MKTVHTICAHRIVFDYKSKSKHAVPDESEIRHVRSLLSENYVQGELCMHRDVGLKSITYRGWWSIEPPVPSPATSAETSIVRQLAGCEWQGKDITTARLIREARVLCGWKKSEIDS